MLPQWAIILNRSIAQNREYILLRKPCHLSGLMKNFTLPRCRGWDLKADLRNFTASKESSILTHSAYSCYGAVSKIDIMLDIFNTHTQDVTIVQWVSNYLTYVLQFMSHGSWVLGSNRTHAHVCRIFLNVNGAKTKPLDSTQL